MQNADLPTRLALEKQELAAKVGTAKANEKIASINSGFYEKTGRDREPFLKAMDEEKKKVTEGVALLRNANVASKALQTDKVTAGWGGEQTTDSARLRGARQQECCGNRSGERAVQDRLGCHAGVWRPLVQWRRQPCDRGRLAAAKGLTGNLDLQRQSQQRIISAMQEDLHGKLGKYEDDREKYLKGDPQHQFFKVETQKIEPKMREALMKDPENAFFQNEFDRTYGKGAAALEIRRIRRRMHQEDE